MLRDINQEPLAFYMWHYACKKHKIDVNGRQLGDPFFGTRWFIDHACD
jgi:hypothetical protein